MSTMWWKSIRVFKHYFPCYTWSFARIRMLFASSIARSSPIWTWSFWGASLNSNYCLTISISIIINRIHGHITCSLDVVEEFAKHYFDSIDIWDFFSSSIDRSITAVCVVVHTVPLISDEILIMLTNINYTSIVLEEIQKQARVLWEARKRGDGGKSPFSEKSSTSAEIEVQNSWKQWDV